MQAGTPLSYQLEVDDGTIWFKNQNTTIGYCRYASNGDIEYIYVHPMYRLMGFGKALVDQFARYVLPGYDFTAIRSTGDKVTRARPFAAAMANGNVRVVRGIWLSDWMDELASFPEASDHDDQVDSAAGAFAHLTGLGLPQRKKVSIVV